MEREEGEWRDGRREEERRKNGGRWKTENGEKGTEGREGHIVGRGRREEGAEEKAGDEKGETKSK
jgi:hypothetical protein